MHFQTNFESNSRYTGICKLRIYLGEVKNLNRTRKPSLSWGFPIRLDFIEMKKRKVHESRFVPKKGAKILNHGGKLESSATTPLEQAESSLRYNSLHEAEKGDIIPHLNLGGKDKSDPTLPETKKADDFHQPSPGGEDKNDPGLKTAAATLFINPGKPCCDYHLIYGELCATFVLDYYNRENVKNFELVKDKRLRCSPLISTYDASYDTSIDCVFYAKDDKDDSSTKMFLSQLDYNYNSNLKVTKCKVSEGVVGDLPDVNINSADDSSNPDTPEYKPVSLDFDPYAYEKDLKLRNKRIAESALDHYNEKNGKGAKYELKKNGVIENHLFSDTSGDWFHCCFYAVESSTEQDNLFFAEVKYNYPSKPDVHCCMKLDGLTTLDCMECYPQMKHPDSGVGKYCREPIIRKDTPSKNISAADADPYDYWKCFGIYEDPRKRTPSHAEDYCPIDRRIFGILFANIALRVYNDNNGSYFKLVEDGSLDNVPKKIDPSEFNIRCSFIAEKNYSMMRFSADLKYVRPSVLTVTFDSIKKITENGEEDCKHEQDYAGEVEDITDEFPSPDISDFNDDNDLPW